MQKEMFEKEMVNIELKIHKKMKSSINLTARKTHSKLLSTNSSMSLSPDKEKKNSISPKRS